MDEDNVFAILTPFDSRGLARVAFRLNHNTGLYYSEQINGIALQPLISSRQATPASPSDKSRTQELCGPSGANFQQEAQGSTERLAIWH